MNRLALAPAFLAFALALPALAQGLEKDPTQGTTNQAVGAYSSGRLRNATALAETGPGYVKLGYKRRVHFGTYDLTRVIELAAEDYLAAHPGSDPARILDLSKREGGQFDPHSSHQNGLDVDIYYFRTEESSAKSVPQTTDELEKAPLTKAGQAPLDLERGWTLFKAFVHTGRVSRIFVNPAIKSRFCAYAREIGEEVAEAETLRRLRPWSGHLAHFHVRLTCPEKSPQCRSQPEIPEGTGCDD